MKDFDLIHSTLKLVKLLHENPSSGANYHNAANQLVKERIELAPKTLEQVENALRTCKELMGKQALKRMMDSPFAHD